MAELAQAYIQIMPSTRGIKGALSKELGGEAGQAGESAGKSIASKIFCFDINTQLSLSKTWLKFILYIIK